MRTIHVLELTQNIKQMCIEANHCLAPDMDNALKNATVTEKSPLGKQILNQLQENLAIAKEDRIPICQDTGMAVIFLEIGQDVHAVIHYELKPGNKVKITVAPKGFGSENMSRIFMLKPADGIEGVKNAILTAVKDAGPNACPPMVVGVGIGGTFEKCALMAKKALTRPVNQHSDIPYIKEMEKELLDKINCTGIGPGGLGGTTTALAVNIDTYPTHIAGLPVAINICCHVNRHAVRII